MKDPQSRLPDGGSQVVSSGHLGATSYGTNIVPSFTNAGVTIRYDDTGNGKPAILLHCAGTSRRQWKDLAGRMGPEYRVLAPDMIGFGETDPWPGDSLSLDQEAKIMGRLLDLFDGPAHLVGHSFGATIGLKLAHLYPGRFASLTLFEPIPFRMLDYAGESELFDEVHGLGLEFLERFKNQGPEAGARVFGVYWLGEAGWNKLPEPARRMIVESCPMLRLEFLAKIADQTRFEDFSDFTVPTLLVNGATSRRVGRRIAELFVEAMPEARRAVIPGNHMAPATDPASFSRIVVDYIAQYEALRKL